jgi:hypothetical protein
MYSVNNKVERHSYGISSVSEYGGMSDAAATHQYLKQKAVLEHTTAIDESAAKSEKVYEQNQSISKVVMGQLSENQVFETMNQLTRDGKELLFREVIFEAFSKSLHLDDDFVIAQEANLRQLTDSFVDGKGGFKYLEEAIKSTKSPFLKKIKTVCEATANKVARRKLSEVQQGQLRAEQLKFELNEDEKNEFDYDKEKINIDQLSDLVKKKVLTVIQDEKTRQAKEEEVIADLESESDEQKAVKEAIMNELPVEESTIFNSILRNSYKEQLETVVKENNVAAYQGAALEDEEDENGDPELYDVDLTADDVRGSEFRGDSTAAQEAQRHGSVQSDIDMDLILAESITKYTLMELCYTIQLENYTYDELRKYSQNLLN